MRRQKNDAYLSVELLPAGVAPRVTAFLPDPCGEDKDVSVGKRLPVEDVAIDTASGTVAVVLPLRAVRVRTELP